MTAWQIRAVAGTAGLAMLAAGPVAAIDQRLDGTGREAARPIRYAAETLVESVRLPGGGTVYPLMSPALIYGDDRAGRDGHQTHTFTVGARFRIVGDRGFYVRLDLGGGMVFLNDRDAGVDSRLSYEQRDASGRSSRTCT